VHLDKLSAPLADQVIALRAAAEYCPDLDLERVAIRGWSFGGTLAAAAVPRRPDVFHAAVAGAPAVDQRLYDTHWSERFLGHPDQRPAAYDRSSLLLDAPALRRPLLVVHGMADDNVVPAHTLRLSAALLTAGRPHQVPLSGMTHMPTTNPAWPGCSAMSWRSSGMRERPGRRGLGPGYRRLVQRGPVADHCASHQRSRRACSTRRAASQAPPAASATATAVNTLARIT
jgi:dienelactone hydrolase